MTRVTQGARQRRFILWLGFRIDVVNLKHSVRYESLIRETRVHPSQSYMSISGFITYGQPGITALPRITANGCHNHNTEQPLLLSLKPRLI